MNSFILTKNDLDFFKHRINQSFQINKKLKN